MLLNQVVMNNKGTELFTTRISKEFRNKFNVYWTKVPKGNLSNRPLGITLDSLSDAFTKAMSEAINETFTDFEKTLSHLINAKALKEIAEVKAKILEFAEGFQDFFLEEYKKVSIRPNDPRIIQSVKDRFLTKIVPYIKSEFDYKFELLKKHISQRPDPKNERPFRKFLSKTVEAGTSEIVKVMALLLVGFVVGKYWPDLKSGALWNKKISLPLQCPEGSSPDSSMKSKENYQVEQSAYLNSSLQSSPSATQPSPVPESNPVQTKQ